MYIHKRCDIIVVKLQTPKKVIYKSVLEILGVEYTMQSKEVREKSKATNMERYGVENVMHDPTISERSMLNSYKTKNYILPSGEVCKYQGYENHAFTCFQDYATMTLNSKLHHFYLGR